MVYARNDMPISFPGLFGDWEVNPSPVAIPIGNGIYWYGIILAFAMLMGLLLCMKQAGRFGLKEDHVLDMVLWGVPCCVLGSRIYYVIFYLDLYRTADGGLDWGRMIAIWDGGLAIYGTVIAGALLAFFYTRRKKLKLGALTDLCVLGLLLGQIIGRWANFINREAFGGLTDLPWRMRLWVSSLVFKRSAKAEQQVKRNRLFSIRAARSGDTSWKEANSCRDSVRRRYRRAAEKASIVRGGQVLKASFRIWKEAFGSCASTDSERSSWAMALRMAEAEANSTFMEVSW